MGLQEFQLLFTRLGISMPTGRTTRACRALLTRKRCFVSNTRRLLRALCNRCQVCLIAGNALDIRGKQLGDSKVSHCFRDVFVSRRLKCGGPNERCFSYYFSEVPSFRGRATMVVKSDLASSVRNNVGTKVHAV